MALSLAIKDLDAGYGAVRALRHVSLDVKSGETVALLGTNGNGKSTLMKCVMGLVRPQRGSVSLSVDGERHDLTRLSPEAIVDLGVALVPEGRRLFPKLTVIENLMLGAFRKAARKKIDRNLSLAFETFPVLKERRNQLAGTMSGGQQQMLAIARALMSRPRLLLLDEPSLGLSPKLADQVLAAVGDIVRDGTSVLLAEQNVSRSLQCCDRAYVLEVGRVALSGAASALRDSEAVRRAYLGG